VEADNKFNDAFKGKHHDNCVTRFLLIKNTLQKRRCGKTDPTFYFDKKLNQKNKKNKKFHSRNETTELK
jgi:hypothetical protein